MDYLLYLGLGALAGLISGLLGLGGGVVIVPILILSFELQGMAPEISTHVAIGTSLATIVVTSLTSIFTHHQKNSVHWDLVMKISPGILLGSVLGGLLALSLNGSLLQLLFGGFLVLISLQIIFYTPIRGEEVTPSPVMLGIAGTSIGGLSTLVGIGGGSMMAPFLSYNGFKFHHAVGTAAACGFPISFVATLIYISASIPSEQLPARTLGYIFIPAWLGIVLASMPFARIGALIAHRINERRLKQVFAAIILVLGVRFIWLNALINLE